MAPVYDFRHVELDKIGRGKRIVKPPGGECSDIFGSNDICQTPRKTKNYMQSNIFTPDAPDSGVSSPNGSTPSTPGKLLDTQDRLFGFSGDEETPRKVVDRLRSSIFEEEVDHSRPKTTPVRRPSINPITGEPIALTPNGSTPNGKLNGHVNGHNGHHGMNGHGNGYANGCATPESPMSANGSPRVRMPPGGKSSGIF